MKKIMALCLATILLLLTAPANVSALTPPRYPAPIFYCKEALVEWLKTADPDFFHEGNFRNVLPQVRERGEILRPAIVDDRITFQGVEVLRFAQRGATLWFRYGTPAGQLVVIIEEIDPRFASLYEYGGTEAYFAAVENDRYERALSEYLQWGDILMPGMREPLQRPVRRDNFDAYFITNGFVVRPRYTSHLPEIGAFLDGLAWELAPIAPAEDIRVFLDGERLAFDVPPQIINGRTMVPMRVIFEALGSEFFWDGETQTVSANLPLDVTGINANASLQIGNNLMTIRNTGITGIPQQVELDVPPQIIDNRTLVPLRAVSEVFGADVDWCSDTRTVNIRTADYF